MRLHQCLLLLFALLSPLVQGAILAIDYGAEFTKLSLVKPGTPFDVLLDRDAKRKISSVVGWKKNDRVFGAEGKMSPLIAATEVPDLPIYPNPPLLTDDGSLIFKHANVPDHIKPAPSADAAWTPVDLLAHQIAAPAASRRPRGGRGREGTSERVTPKSKHFINTTHVEALAVGYEHVGAVNLDIATRDLIQDAFVKKTSRPDVKDDARAMARLSKEAVRVKQILSANQEAQASVESLFDDLDFRGMISREQLEDKMAKKLPEFTAPIKNALKDAGLTIDDITSVLFFGGNARVPMVQTAVRDYLGGKDDKVAQSVNGDEAAVLGAAFYGASISRQFKMKSIEIDEHSSYDYSLAGDVVFPKGTVQGERKTLLLKPEDKLDLVFEQSGTPILEVNIPDISAALANFTAPEPVVNLTLRLDKRGFFSVAQAALTSNQTDVPEKAKGVLGGLFGKKDKTETSADADAETEGAENKTEAEKAAEKPKKAPRVILKYTSKPLFKTMSKDEKRITKERLASIGVYEAALRAREEARNRLEAYLYRVQNYLSDEPDSKALFDFGTDEERERLSSGVASAFEWLHEYAESAPAGDLVSRLTELEALEAPIALRYTEWMARPTAVDKFQQAMHAGRAFLLSATENRTEALKAAESATDENPVAPPKYTEEELLKVANMLKEYEQWIDPLMTEQVKLNGDMKADPVIFSKDLDDKGKTLQIYVQALEKRKDPRVPRPKKKAPPKEDTKLKAEEREEQPEVVVEETEQKVFEEPVREEQEIKHDEL
ncbi:hypothetical protein A1Q2_05752 [Trichosporon asahii var. asahii CBS 8904]|uniref:Hypoxia up-regulated 1 n=1 Tax=Trichosporon asahii var. asahii (strain CBS 8904) TaxID=1220162 RepID=K1WE79_TRIAC|nr:hypothetical protein A1Q2_05752 [Trichosporon asahii var. asahii CBS 8904]